MVLGNRGRGLTTAVFGPLARALVRAGVSPNTVTVIGALAVTAVSLTLLPTDHLIVATVIIVALALADSVDGLMAREKGPTGPFGAFLDSTLDRLSDAAVFSGVTLWFLVHTGGAVQVFGVAAGLACIGLGGMVSYARARAESVGAEAKVGIAERTDRLIAAGIGTLAVGLGAPPLVLATALTVVALASLFTVCQRIAAVFRAVG